MWWGDRDKRKSFETEKKKNVFHVIAFVRKDIGWSQMLCVWFCADKNLILNRTNSYIDLCPLSSVHHRLRLKANDIKNGLLFVLNVNATQWYTLSRQSHQIVSSSDINWFFLSKRRTSCELRKTLSLHRRITICAIARVDHQITGSTSFSSSAIVNACDLLYCCGRRDWDHANHRQPCQLTIAEIRVRVVPMPNCEFF